MSARILVVDDTPLNVKLLAAKLTHDYYVVRTAADGLHALRMVEEEAPDLILLDVMMPELDGFETCRRLKNNPATRHIPVVMVTALSDTADRVRGLEAGADDFLTKPINDLALMARVRSLLRLKMMMDEWRLREGASPQLTAGTTEEEAPTHGRHIVLLEDVPEDRATIQEALTPLAPRIQAVASVDEAIAAAQAELPDLVIVSLNLVAEDGLRLCARLRASEATRNLPLLLVADAGETERVARGLDLGANDYVLRPLEGAELLARARTQLRQKSHYDRLKKNYEQSLALALVDPLTGAFNRRYLDSHLPKLVARSRSGRRGVALLFVDVDRFKAINDSYGHATGDAVLKEMVHRMTLSLRPMDLVVRLGGEEFAVILPDTGLPTALEVAERLREVMAGTPFAVPEAGLQIPVTASFGVACLRADAEDETPMALMARADAAVYQAKQTGRNRVVNGEQEPGVGI